MRFCIPESQHPLWPIDVDLFARRVNKKVMCYGSSHTDIVFLHLPLNSLTFLHIFSLGLELF